MDNHRTQNVSTFLVWSICALGLFIDGFDLYIASVAEPFFHRQFHLTSFSTGLIQAAAPIGAVLGAIMIGRLADSMGRKSMLLLNLCFFVGAALLSGFAWNITSLCFFRFLVGFGVGADYPLCAAYLTEMVEQVNRGKLAAAAMFINCMASPLGVLIALLIFKLDASLNAWRYMFMFGAVPATIGLALRVRLPESFIWQAKRHLKTSSKKAKYFAVLFSRKYWKITFALSACWLLQDISYYGIGLFTPSILQAMHLSAHGDFISDTANIVWATLFTNIFIVIGAFISILLIDRIGRVRLQKLGFLFSFFALFILGLGAYVGYLHNTITIFACFMMYNLFINLGPGITTYLLPAELYPTRIRATGHGLASGSAKFGAFLGAMFLPLVQAWVGVYMTVLLLSLTLLLGFSLTSLLPNQTREEKYYPVTDNVF